MSDIKALLLTSERINYGDTYKTKYVGEVTYSQIPIKDSYIQIKNNNFLSYQVKEIIYLQQNRLNFDIAILVGNGLKEIQREYFDSLMGEISSANITRAAHKYMDEQRLKNPDSKWQEKRTIFERMRAGEKAEEIAIEMNMSIGQIKRRYSDWKYLLYRVPIQKEEEAND